MDYYERKVFRLKCKMLVIGGSYMNLQMKITPKNKIGDVTPGSDYRYHPYGDSAITAISAAKLGGECVFATRFGNDTNGKRLYEYYKACGISNTLMRKDENAQTGMSISLYSDLEHFDNYVASGTSVRFSKEEIEDSFIVMPDLFLAPLEELGYVERTVVVKAEKKDDMDEPSFVKSLARAEGYSMQEEESEKDEAEEAESENDEVSESEHADVAEETEEENKAEEEAKEEAPDADTKEKLSPISPISAETVTSYIEKESLALYAMEKAKERKVDVLLQYTPFTAQYPLKTYDNIKILVISDELLYKLTGFFPNTTEKALRSLMALSQTVKARYYIVQQGNHSAFIYDGTRYEVVSAPALLVPRAPKPNEKGMQQTFMGALAAEYLETKNVVRAAKFAIIVSLLTRAKFGNLERMMSRRELEQYASEHGIELYK